MAGLPDYAGAVITVAAVLTAFGVIGKWVRSMYRTIRRLNVLMDQLLGDADSKPPRPPLVDRITRMEVALDDHVKDHAPPAPPRSNVHARR